VRAAHTVEQIREAEAPVLDRLAAEGQPDTLMQRAAYGLACAVLDFLGSAYGRQVRLLVGPGNNGGDALYAGAVLARRGAAVEALLVWPDRVHERALGAFLAAGGRLVPAEVPARTAGAGDPEVDVVIDGILGIGARGGLPAEATEALQRFAGAPLIAVDVPSGIHADTGELTGPHARAVLTVTFGAYKIAHLVDPAAQACGAVHLVDLDLSLPEAAVQALQDRDVAELLPSAGPSGHKYSRGVVGVRTGSAEYPGAAVLSVGGALCGLAGMVRYVGSAADGVQQAHPEVVVGAGRVQAWVVGSGGGEEAAEALKAALADGCPVVVDADGLAPFADLVAARSVSAPVSVPVVLTPHAGELARLLGVTRDEVEARLLHHVREAADRFGAVVLLKGRRTLIAEPGSERVRVNTTGVPWLATAGSGDVLAGLIGALLASGLSPFDAGSVGAWLHGAAGTLASAGGPITATQIAETLPQVFSIVSHERFVNG
jgi:ADP-dependent NAD(P)H-hydrate dehydratase / NAD(P)H-hydrate epimerase